MGKKVGPTPHHEPSRSEETKAGGPPSKHMLSGADKAGEVTHAQFEEWKEGPHPFGKQEQSPGIPFKGGKPVDHGHRHH